MTESMDDYRRYELRVDGSCLMAYEANRLAEALDDLERVVGVERRFRRRCDVLLVDLGSLPPRVVAGRSPLPAGV